MGNLQSVTYPNGVVHNYTYDSRNRLTNLGVTGTVSGAPGSIAGYTILKTAAGAGRWRAQFLLEAAYG